MRVVRPLSLSVASFVVVGAFVGACQEEELVVQPSGVAGNVCNPLTGLPASFADVSCTYVDAASGEERVRTTKTDKQGFFELAGIAVGDRTLVVRTPEFEREYAVTLEQGVTAQLDDPACRYPPPPPGLARLVGQICNQHTGETVKNATITVTAPDESTTTTTTDPETGDFSVEVPTGTLVVDVDSRTYRKSYVVEVEDGDIIVVDQTSECRLPDPITTGFITGQVCDPGGAGVGGALVTAKWKHEVDGVVQDETFTLDTLTLPDGTFILDPISPTPAVNVSVVVEADGLIARWDQLRVVARRDNPDGLVLTGDDGACKPLVPDDDRRYAVVTGFYDRIEDFLTRDGVSVVPIDGQNDWAEEFFGSLDNLEQYDVIFINCGANEREFAGRAGLSANARRNLRTYVEQGGGLYVSDWAYAVVEQVFSDRIDFFGDDEEHDAAEMGVGGTYQARVLDAGLGNFLAQSGFANDAVDIEFSFQAGSIITGVSPGVTTFLEADMQFRTDAANPILRDTPITVGFRQGRGRVIFTSFHQETDPEDGTSEVLDGPEDAVLRYLVFNLDSF
jgi:hypothetical protein